VLFDEARGESVSTDRPIPERISAEAIVRRVVENAIRVSCARWSIIESLGDDADMTEDDLVDDTIGIALGEDTGCLGDDEMDAEHIDLIFVQEALERERGTAESLIRGLASALNLLLEEHSCDDGSADFDGTTRECESCMPAKSALSLIPAHLRAPETTGKEFSDK
jgi:hypothetical protein